jgi:hypothetical protein
MPIVGRTLRSAASEVGFGSEFQGLKCQKSKVKDGGQPCLPDR